MNKKIPSIKWEDIYSTWVFLSHMLDPCLLQELTVSVVEVDTTGMRYYIDGYDWVKNEDYDDRIAYVTQETAHFMMFGPILKKGTIYTGELLGNASKKPELCAAIWIAAFLLDLEKNIPESWCGKPFSIMAQLLNEALQQLRINEIWPWHHAMRDRTPDMCFYRLLHYLTPSSIEMFLEPIVINTSCILNKYKLVHYINPANKVTAPS